MPHSTKFTKVAVPKDTHWIQAFFYLCLRLKFSKTKQLFHIQTQCLRRTNNNTMVLWVLNTINNMNLNVYLFFKLRHIKLQMIRTIWNKEFQKSKIGFNVLKGVGACWQIRIWALDKKNFSLGLYIFLNVPPK